MQITALLIGTLAFADSSAVAQPLTLAYQQAVTRKIEGATAAFSLDPSRVGAAAQNGEVTVVGRAPGSTHVIVIIGDRYESFQVFVNHPPTVAIAGAASAGSLPLATSLYDVRYTSNPGILQGTFRSSRREGNRTTEFLLGGATPFEDTGWGAFSLPLAAYSIRTPDRELTLFDRVVTNSPLTISRSNVRGLHLRSGPWQLHAGYSFFATFEHLLLPTNKEAVAGVGYRYRLRPRTTLTPNVYYFAAETEGGRSGSVGTLLYETAPAKDVKIAAELGVSRAIGGAVELEIDRVNRRLWGKVRFAPPSLPSLTTDQQSGREVESRWTSYGKRLSVNASVSSRIFTHGVADHASNIAGIDLQYRLARAWTIHGGPGYSAFDTSARPEFKVHSVTLPVGAQFVHREFGLGLDYQFSRETNRDLAGHLIRADVSGASRGFRLSAFGERQTQAPTAGYILTTIPWLQQMLDRLGLTANTPEQLADLLRVNAEISAYGYANDLTIHVAPVRARLGASFGWSGSRATSPQLFASTLVNRDESIDRTSRGELHTVSYSQRLGAGTDIFSNWSLLCRDGLQGSPRCRPVFSVSLRQTLNSAPRVLLPQRQGQIRGTVFRDEQGLGSYSPGVPTLSGVEVVLDGVRRTLTDGAGRFRFEGVPFGRHRVEVRIPASESIFFTTPSPTEVDTGETVDFGIGTLLSGLRGEVHNDAGTGLAGVIVHIVGADRQVKVQTADDGTFVARGLPAGTYEVKVEAGSIPPGYPLDSLQSQPIIVDKTAMGNATFVIRPYRSVAGNVRIFDRNAGIYMPLPGTTVELRPLQQKIVTDVNGRYLFRDLPPGDHVLVATHNGREHPVALSVPQGPVLLKDVDISVASPDRAEVDSPASPVESSQTRTTIAVPAPEPPNVSFVVQIAALKNARRARMLVAELKGAGLPAYLVEPLPSDSNPLHRVRLGHYKSRSEANNVAGVLEKTRGGTLWVTTEPTK